MKTLDITEASSFLRICKARLRRRAASGEIPGTKNGRCWVFIDVDLIDWMRGNYKTNAKQKEATKCSTNVVVSIGASGRSAAKELEKRLAQTTRKPPKNGMTGDGLTSGAK